MAKIIHEHHEIYGFIKEQLRPIISYEDKCEVSKASFSEDRYLQFFSFDATLFPSACLNMGESFQDYS